MKCECIKKKSEMWEIKSKLWEKKSELREISSFFLTLHNFLIGYLLMLESVTPQNLNLFHSVTKKHWFGAQTRYYHIFFHLGQHKISQYTPTIREQKWPCCLTEIMGVCQLMYAKEGRCHFPWNAPINHNKIISVQKSVSCYLWYTVTCCEGSIRKLHPSQLVAVVC